MNSKKYKRILLKLSGESLAASNKYGFDENMLLQYAEEIKEIYNQGVEVAVVLGGGNIFRGLQSKNVSIPRVQGDFMGMMATVINSLALQATLQSIGVGAEVLSAVKIEAVASKISPKKVNAILNQKKVCILAGGTGNPFFTTDSAAALRAVEINADVLLKGTRVDAVYSDDPEKNPDAKPFEKLTFNEVIDKKLKVMDLTAFTLCAENNMPIIVFNIHEKGNINKIMNNKKCGTIISNNK